MKNSKLLLYLLPIATFLFWYLGRPPAPEPDTHGPAASRITPASTPPPANIPPTKAADPATNTDPTPAHAGTADAPAHVTPGQSEQNPTHIEQDSPPPPGVPVTGNPAITPDQKLEALRYTFRTYASRHKGNPVGDNAEITAALAGKNPGSANYIADGTHGLNDKGQLCDGWGTPYFFHQLSGTEMEIRSAGPDKKMWTRDDLVTK